MKTLFNDIGLEEESCVAFERKVETLKGGMVDGGICEKS